MILKSWSAFYPPPPPPPLPPDFNVGGSRSMRRARAPGRAARPGAPTLKSGGEGGCGPVSNIFLNFVFRIHNRHTTNNALILYSLSIFCIFCRRTTRGAAQVPPRCRAGAAQVLHNYAYRCIIMHDYAHFSYLCQKCISMHKYKYS